MMRDSGAGEMTPANLSLAPSASQALGHEVPKIIVPTEGNDGVLRYVIIARQGEDGGVRSHKRAAACRGWPVGQVKIKYDHGDLGHLGHGHGYHFVIFLRYGTKLLKNAHFSSCCSLR